MRILCVITASVLASIQASPNSVFAEATACEPHLLQPNGGESFVINEEVTITWENPVGCQVVSADLSWTENEGSNWFYIANGVTGQSYVWQPNQATVNGRIRVIVNGTSGVLGSDLSDGTFEVHGGAENVRFALHRRDFVTNPFMLCDRPSTPAIEPNFSPNYEHIPCDEYTVNGPLGRSTVYIVVAGADPDEGVGAVSFGLDYDGRSGQGTGIEPDFVQITYCADGIPFPNDGGLGEFPRPKGGLRLTWSLPAGCQREVIGSQGVHAVIGALYVYAYSSDLLRITPNNNLSSSPELGVQICDGGFTNLFSVLPADEANARMGRVQFGTGTGGYTPCSASPCVVTVADIDVSPNTINTNSGGKFVSASIELPSGYAPAGVNVGTVRLNEVVAATTFFATGDFNQNGVPDFTVKFPRDDVEAVLPEGDQVSVTITGLLGDDCTFTGTETVRVIRPHLHHPNGAESYVAGAYTQVEWDNPQGWTVGHAQIYYSPDDGDTWQIVADQVIGETYAWRAPQAPTETGRLRVVLFDEAGVMGYDSSDGPFTIQAATGVEQGIPTVHRLHANSPNPFRGATRVAFDLPEPGNVTLKIFDLSGREVRVLADGWYPAGAHEARWDATDAAGQAVAGGIYFLHMKVGSFTDSKRMYLQR